MTCSCSGPQGVVDIDNKWYIRIQCPESGKEEWMKEGSHYHGEKLVCTIYVTGLSGCKYTKEDKDKILKSWRKWMGDGK